MPQFKYQVKKGPGEINSGVLEAENQRAAVSRLRDMGYFPISVEEYAGEEKKESIAQALTRIRLKDRNLFFRQLANLIEAGMPITRALGTLFEQADNPKLKHIVGELKENIQKGSSFAEAMERHPKLFPPMLSNMVKAGETGGMLEEVLWRIVKFGEQEEELRGKAISAMIYPAFLLTVGSIAIFILISFVFPKFVTIFNDFNAQLPLPTRLVMGLCDFMGRFWWAVLIGVALGITALVSYVKTPPGKRKLHLMLLTVPVVRDVVQRYEMAKFARTLGTLLDNGVPVLTALKVTVDTLSNVLIAEEVETIHSRVIEGDSISDSLRQTKYFPPMVVNMFAVGEESGRLGAVTARIADAYDTEVDRAVKAMSALFEPILVVIMGIIVGFLVIAMLLPMLTLSAHVS
jgi:type IV pilus assembly protein PilC